MARPLATPEERDAQRRRIRAAAAALHEELGLQGVSARAIADRAGVSTGTLYRYFDNLPDLMRSLWLEPVTAADAELEAVASAHRSPVKRIRALLEAYAAFAQENPEVFRGALLFVRPSSVRAPEPRPLHELTFARLLCEAIRAGQREGRIVGGNAEELAQVLWSGIHGSLALSVNADAYEVAPGERLAPAMVRTLLRAIEKPARG